MAAALAVSGVRAETSPARSRWPERFGLREKAFAAGMTLAVLLASGALRGTVPFGSRSRNNGDLGDQFGPMHAHFAELLRGGGHGDLLFNWNSGMGVPFLPDFYLYLASPLAPLAALFPAERIDLAMFVLAVVKMMAAAVAMTAYLKVLGRGPWWLLGLFGAAYGLCGWAIDDAAYVPMWLDGLIALPLLCLVGEWARRGRGLLAGPLLIALAWYANFYVAYMATLGAMAVLVARLLTDEPSVRRRLAAGARFVAMTACGVALVMPLFVPVYLAVRAAPKSTGNSFNATLGDFVARLMPTSEGVGWSPGLYVSTTVFVLVLTLPVNRAIPVRQRVVWTALPVVLACSFQMPLQQVWNAFEPPDGSPYRAAFVLCAVLIIVGWLAVIREPPGTKPWVFALSVLVLLYLGVRTSPYVSGSAGLLLALGALSTVVAVTLLRRSGGEDSPNGLLGGRRGSRLAVAAGLGLVGVMFLEQTATAVFTDERRELVIGTTATWGAGHDARGDAIRRTAGFPAYRTDPGDPVIVRNDPMLLGGEGAGYYSSVTPLVTARTLVGLGFGYEEWGRRILSTDNPVLDAIFAVGVRLDVDGGRVTPVRRPAPPLVTVRPGAWQPPAEPDPLHMQQAVLGAEVYEFPAVRWTRLAHDSYRAELRCAPGSTVFGWGPSPSRNVRSWQRPYRQGPGATSLGTVADDGMHTVTVPADPRATVMPTLGCLDMARLSATVAGLRATGATSVEVGGHRIEATLPAGSRGMAVISVTRFDGWRCAAGDGPGREPDSYGGLIAMPLDGSATRLSCVYRPPGLRAGLALAALGLAGLGIWNWAARRRLKLSRR